MTRRTPGNRVLLAIVAGLVTVVVALTVLLIDTAIERGRIEAERAESTRIINQLTKQLYWLEQQIDGTRPGKNKGS